MKKVFITGATGFVGSRLCEVLHLTGVFKPVALVHSTASASRIARFPIDFVVGDLCDRDSIKKATQGCDAVVHLARGDQRLMRTGLRNMLQIAVERSMERFVHLSSVAIYGDHPGAECAFEVPPPKRVQNPYGNEKLMQERVVERFHREKKLPVVILRPPNIYGPFSHFTLNLIQRLRSGTLALVGAGQTPCNLVYIDNLIEAILLALWKPGVAGEAFFITDSQIPTWADCFQQYAKMLGVAVPRVSIDELTNGRKERLWLDSLRQTPRILLSGELRQILREIPLVRQAERLLLTGFNALSPEVRDHLRHAINGPQVTVRNGRKTFDAADNLILAQQRSVVHSSAKAKRLLGYSAPISAETGMALTQDWLRFAQFI